MSYLIRDLDELAAAKAAVNAHGRFHWRQRAREVLAEIEARNLYGAADPPPRHHLRGIDYLTRQRLLFTLTRGINWYAANHGKEPDLLAPRTFTEKLLVCKFFMPVPMPTPADKLLVSHWIPADWRGQVATPRCVWSSSNAEIPERIDAPDGEYFYKCNHGSGGIQRIELPLDAATRGAMQAKAEKWLTSEYGAPGGEWWYGPIPRKVFLEENLAPGSLSADDWKFFVFRGEARMVQVDLDRYTNHVQLVHDRDFNLLDEEFFYRSGSGIPKPARYGQLLGAAEAIGAPFEFARVDLYDTPRGIMLGEITLSPGGARQRVRSPSLDERLGAQWVSPLFPET